MIELLKVSISLIPVFVFLAALIIIDSFKLVKLKSVLQAIVAGIFSAAVCLFINQSTLGFFNIELQTFSRYIAPIIEEIFKSFYLIYLIKTNKTGFVVDAAIFGFAIGAGFSLFENIYYLQTLERVS